MKHIYIAWIHFQRRPESMKSYVGYDLVYIPNPFRTKWLKPLGYAAQAWKTLSAIRRMSPDVVWYQAPPTFIAHLIWLARALAAKRFRVVADCHNGAIEPNALGSIWTRIPGTLAVLRTFDAILVHNSAMHAAALRLGLDPRRLFVLETRPAQIAIATERAGDAQPLVLVPCSFHDDEPVEAVLDAARLMPDVQFKLTGNVGKATAKGFVAKAPANVAFTGYLSVADYTELLRTCSVVLGVTTEEGVQLSAANEAVGAGKAMIMSDTRILRDLFGTAALFSHNTPDAFAATLRTALSQLDSLDAASLALKATREARWRAQADTCLHALATGAP